MRSLLVDLRQGLIEQEAAEITEAISLFALSALF